MATFTTSKCDICHVDKKSWENVQKIKKYIRYEIELLEDILSLYIV